MSEPSSPTSRTPLAFFDPESVCLRTSQATLLSEAPELLQRLPNWGTTQGGVLYELPIPPCLLHTDALDGSASPKLPTPRAQNGENRNMKPWVRPLNEPQNLENALARLPGVGTNQRSDGGNESSDERPPTQ